MVDSAYWIWFQLMFGIGTRRAHVMMEYFEDPRLIADGLAQNGQVVSMLRDEELNRSKVAMEQAVAIRDRTLKKGCDILTPDMEGYPALLQNIYSKPAVLYYKGDLSCLEGRPVVAMVGTRAHTPYGKEVAEFLAGGLAKYGACVVSGLAKGIDTFCHRAALEAGGPTVGVLGCGIDLDYPSGSAGVKTAMSKQGAVLTEFPLGSEPLPWHFPIRNRIISGLAHGTVVVEAGEKSGSMITAGHALDQGREVFAVPGRVFAAQESGNHALLRDGAHLAESPLDILEVLVRGNCFPGVELPPRETVAALVPPEEIAEPYESPREAPLRTETPTGLSDEARLVYQRITPQPVSVEELAAGLTLSVAQLQTALTELEIYGLIRGYPGRRFSL